MLCSQLDRKVSLARECTGRGIVCRRHSGVTRSETDDDFCSEPQTAGGHDPQFKSNAKEERTMKTTLDYKNDFLCVLIESETSDEPRGAVLVREWHPLHKAEEGEVRT